MALRFRRSVKLGKGIKLNLSKKGVGMSVGTTGLRQSIHSTGRGTGTIGIPGTGLSYVNQKKLTGSSKSSANSKAQNEEAVNEYNNYVYAITHLHEQTPEVIDWGTEQSVSPPFQPEETGPEEQKAQDAYDNYEPGFLARLIKPLAEKEKKDLKQAIDQARKQDNATYETWKKQHDFAKRILKGDTDAYCRAIQENQEFREVIERGLSIGIPKAGKVEADIRVKPKDVVPNKKVSLTKKGNLSKRKMGKTDYYKIMKDFVCGYTLWVARALFATLPIETCIIHVTENAINQTTGHRQNEVLLSVKIDKDTLAQLNFAQLDPAAAMDNFEYNMDHLKTKGFRPVKRIDVSEYS